MPGNRNPRDLENYIGEHTTAELALLPIEVLRQGNWCWNISNSRPEIYDGAVWMPFGGGAAGVNVEDDDVAVLTPALTINFGPGINAVDAGGSQADVTPDWALVGDISSVGTADAAGVATTVPRGDHAHQGVHSIREQGQAQLYGDVILAEGANITLAQVGQTITISASGSLAAAPTERPDKFHFFKTGGRAPEGDAPQTGYPSQRCMARSDTYNNTYYLFRNVDLLDNQFIIRVEHLSTTPGVNTALDRCVWDVEITIPDANNHGETPGTWTVDSLPNFDFCMVIDDLDNLHIITIGEELATARQMTIDAIVDIGSNAELQVPSYATAAAPPEPMAISVTAETVTSDQTAGTTCSECSAAFTANSVANPVGSTVIVAWIQSTAPLAFDNLYSNAYDPAAAIGGMYPGVNVQVDGSGEESVNWPTVEVGSNYVYIMYIIGSSPKFAQSAFDYTAWSIMAPGVGVSDVVANCPTTTNPMSMCVATFGGTTDVIYFVIEDNAVGQGEKFLVVLLEDFLTTGTGASYNISIYDTFNANEPEKYFQLGINKIAWDSEDCAPTLFMLHGKNGLGETRGVGPIEIHMTIISPDLVSGFIASDLPISPSGGSRISGVNLDAICMPKVHFAYEEYNRVWDGDASVDYTYYPLMVYATLSIYSWDTDSSQFTNVVSLWIKDIPEYPYICVEKAY